ncbi:LOW QUALITY PROTEIN: tripartite motif-containing protein 54-like, partial [Pleuronectes platessa]|uniref:LOW QUALITY PROTEIN: tripartite motif-containing protein 54-like n=1 Tax=Pleuronectes platessa TaxID=8262 RepID=UPI00232A455C
SVFSSRPVNMKPEQQQQLMCDDHEEEKINIYCVSCETPTCSMCKVFGRHKDCDVAPLGSVYMRQKTELSDGIAILVASNDNIQAAISQLEDICHTVEESGRRQREQLAAHFSGLVSVLEERKQELVGHISREQDGKLKHLRGLIRRHSDHQEAAVTLVESGIQTMEEQHMAVFIQSASVLLEKMAVTARASNVERPELGFESMSHFSIDTDHLTEMLHNMDFCSGVGDEEDSEDVGEESEPDFGCRY